MGLQLALLAVYAAAMVVLGLAVGRRVRTAKAFFVAGRSLGPGLLFATMLAANIGAGSTVGAAGLAYRDGLAAWWWVGSAGIGTILLALWIGPRSWRLAREHDLRTVGDLLELRFGPATRAAVTAFLWLGTLAILAGQLIAVAWMLDAVAGVPKTVGCLLGGVAMTAYFAAGGLVTSVWVNLVQLVVLLAGFLVAAPLAVQAAGGLAVVAPAPQSFLHGSASGWTLLPLLVPAFMLSPGLVQKAWGARDERAVIWGTGLCGLALLGFSFLPVLLGMAARLLHPGLDNPELALPVLLVHDLPAWVGFLGLAAVFSAEVSSADAILFMLATSLSQDLYKRFLAPAASEERVLTVARWTAIAGGALGVGLAVLLPSVIGALSIFYACLGVALFVPLVASLHVGGRGRAVEAVAAVAAGIVALLAARAASGGPGWGIWTPSLLGLVASAVAFVAVKAIGRRSAGRDAATALR